MTDLDAESTSIGAIDMEENENVDGEFIQTKLKDEKMVKRNSVDNYKNDSAGVREIIGNSSAGIMEAQEEGLLLDEKGEIIIRLTYEEDGWKLVIKDNGIGMGRDRLEKVSAMGESTSSMYEDRIGRYGIGFYAVFCLTELSGTVLLSTISRKTDEKFFCKWSLNGGKILSRESTNLDDEYGTKLELYLKDDLDPEDVDEWIRTHAFATRQVVKYEREYEGEIEEKVYPHIDLTEQYNSDGMGFEISNDLFTAVTSPSAESHRLLLDISVPSDYGFKLPWNVAIRFHTEEKTVVATKEYSVLDEEIPPNSIIGQSILPSDQYDMIEDKMKEKYIPKRELSEHVVYTPSSAGTRDSLSEVSQFMSWLESEFRSKLQSELDQILDKNILEECTAEELLFVHQISGSVSSNRHLRQNIEKYSSMSLWKDPVLESLTNFVGNNISVEDSTFHNLKNMIDSSYKYGEPKFSAMSLYTFMRENNVEVFMGVSINERKAQFAKEYFDNAIFVKLSESNEYDIYSRLGWKKLKDLNKSYIDSINIDKSEKEKYKKILQKEENNQHRYLKDEKITIRFGVGRRGNLHTIPVKKIKSKLESSNGRIGRFPFNKLVLFPDSESEKVSDYYDLGDNNICVAKCDDEIKEYFESVSNAVTYREYMSSAKKEVVPTTKDILTGSELLLESYDTLSVTLIGESASNMLDEEHYRQEAVEAAFKRIKDSTIARKGSTISPDDLHITMTPSQERDIRPVLHKVEAEYKLILCGDSIHTGINSPDWHTKEKYTGNVDTTRWIASMKLSELSSDKKEELYQFLSSGSFNFPSGGKEAIECLVDGARSN